MTIEGTTLLGLYRVSRKLAEGGMAEVYLGTNLSLNTPVVVKVPKPVLLSDPSFRKRFLLEVERLTRLSHPHIVSILATGTDRGLPFLVSPFLDGGTLHDRLTYGSAPLAYPETLAWSRQIAAALDYIHAEGVIHRDVTPRNVLFDASGNAYLSDFGIAKVVAGAADTTKLTRVGVGVGTPAYAAPEQTAGGEGTPRADQYALATCIYQALAGRLPYEADDVVALLVQKHDAPAPRLSGGSRAVSPAVDDALARALSVRPEARFPSCRQFVEAFESPPRLEPATTPTADVAPPRTRSERPRRRRAGGGARLLLFLLGALVVGGAIAGGVRLLGGAATEPDGGPAGVEKPAEPWVEPLERSLAAGRGDRWRAAEADLTQAIDLGLPADRVPAWLARGIEQWRAPPELDILTPLEGETVRGLALSVRGELTAARATDELFVDDEPAQLRGGSFHHILLRGTPGRRTLRLEVRDGSETRLAVHRTVEWERYDQPSHTGMILGRAMASRSWRISLGKEDGVERGFRYVVSRDGAYVATLEVRTVWDVESTAEVVKDLQRGEIRTGDAVEAD